MGGSKKKGLSKDPFPGGLRDDRSPDSPFNDRFVFEEEARLAALGKNSTNNSPSTGKGLVGRKASILKDGSPSKRSKKGQQISFRDSHQKTDDFKNDEFEEISFENFDDQKSFTNTPIINQGGFAVKEDDEDKASFWHAA